MKKFTSLKLFLCGALMAFAGTMQAASTTVTFDFQTSDGLSALGITMPEASNADTLTGKTLTLGDISMTSTDGSVPTRIWNAKGKCSLRVYANGGSITFTTAKGAMTAMTMTATYSDKLDFTASTGTFTISEKTGTWSGSASSVTFTPTAQNQIYTVVITYDPEGTPGETTGDDDPVSTVTELPYTEAFSSGIGTMSVTNSKVWTSGSYNGTYYMKASGYKKGDNSANFEGSAVLYSPWLNVKDYDEVTLAFDNCINAYFTDVTTEATLYVYTSETDSTQLTFTYPDAPSSGYSDFASSSIDVACADAEQIRFGWVYTSSSSSAGTWEIANVSVSAEGYVTPPTFSPEAGSYQEQVTVTITAGEDAVIYYTTDGSDPTTESTTYNGAFTLTETTTVKAIAEDAAGELSEIVTAEYVITEATVVELDYSETLASGMGDMTTGNSAIWTYASNYSCMKATGYKKGANSANYEGSAVLYTPWINVKDVDGVTVSFDHCINAYFNDLTNEATLYVYTSKTDSAQVEITTYPDSPESGWSDFVSTSTDVDCANAEQIRFGWVYTSSSSSAGTWEIKNVKVAAQVETGINEVKVLGTDARAYDLQGRRVAQPTKGFYIVNGQKVLMK